MASVSGLKVTVKRKVYPSTGVCALADMEFDASPGEFLAIVGPSGAGKSTLLNIIAGLDIDLEGDVHFDGRLLHQATTPMTRIGFMFQEARLMPWLTVLDNVQLVLEPNHNGTDYARRLLEQVELSDFETAYPGQLSGGMQRRLALARAFSVRPALLLMDEPFLSLDAPTASRLRNLLLQLWQDLRPIVIFVTHNLREALALADRVLFFSNRPARVVLSFPIDIRRPRDLEDPRISELHDRLLSEYPDLLSGLTAEGSESDSTLDRLSSQSHQGVG